MLLREHLALGVVGAETAVVFHVQELGKADQIVVVEEESVDVVDETVVDSDILHRVCSSSKRSCFEGPSNRRQVKARVVGRC